MSLRRITPALVLTLLLAGCGEQAQTTPAGPLVTPRIATPAPTVVSGETPELEPSPAPSPAQSPAQPTSEPQTSLPRFDPDAVSLTFDPFAGGLGQLTFLANAGDGSGLLYAVEQAGTIMIIEADGSIRPQPFLDIDDRVSSGGERGLLGLAFHPGYAENGRFFVNYTNAGGDTVVAEFTRSPDALGDPASERILLTIEQPRGNHNGGMLDFGPDGFLYISTGDGGGGGDPLGAGQDLSNHLGAILRIDVDSEEPYVVPSDNPFIGVQGAQPEIWAYGLRNPWRFSFDRLTGDMFIADVGQSAWEEINVEPAGEGGRNYGWNVMEGPECFRADECDMTGLAMPVAWYPLEAGQCAVTGGYVYRGERYPELAGAYLFADYCSGVVWGLAAATAVAEGQATFSELGSSGLRPSAFGEDEAGELYLVGHNGDILRLGARQR